MITVGEQTVYFGDFHGQWNAAEEELALLVAGLCMPPMAAPRPASGCRRHNPDRSPSPFFLAIFNCQ